MSKKGGEGTGEVTMEGLELLLKSNGITEEERAIFETMFTESAKAKRKQLRSSNKIVRLHGEAEKRKQQAAAKKKPIAKKFSTEAEGPSISIADVVDEATALEAAKHYRTVEAPKRLVELTEKALSNGFMTDGLLKRVMRAEFELRRTDYANEIVDMCLKAWGEDGGSVGRYTEAVRWLCRLERVSEAKDVLINIGVNGTAEAVREDGTVGSLGMPVDDASSLFLTMGYTHLRYNDTNSGSRVLREMCRMGCKPTMEYCNELLRLQGKRKHIDAMFNTLDLIRQAGLFPDTDSYQHLANTLVRTVDFVLGAVSIDTLPQKPVLPEAVFIGRSNVGKSSLLNMVLNRNNIAFTSKTPGKTQQFNYFLVNAKSAQAFYLVDVPGVGFAKVPAYQREKWAGFFEEYLSQREGLRVVFHLMDSRHGPLKADLEIMASMRVLCHGVAYVVVLTKADKKDGKISPTVFEDVTSALEQSGLPVSTPVLTTSAVNKLGRDAVWKYLRLAVVKKNSGSGGVGGGDNGRVVIDVDEETGLEEGVDDGLQK